MSKCVCSNPFSGAYDVLNGFSCSYGHAQPDVPIYLGYYSYVAPDGYTSSNSTTSGTSHPLAGRAVLVSNLAVSERQGQGPDSLTAPQSEYPGTMRHCSIKNSETFHHSDPCHMQYTISRTIRPIFSWDQVNTVTHV